MKLISSTILSAFLLSACTSDEVVKAEKKEFFAILKNYANESLSKNTPLSQSFAFPNTKKWLKKFNQPIILTSSVDKKNQSTLVSLGNNQDRLTWVSADGISLTYDNGVLIATRGFAQDLLSLKYEKPNKLFTSRYRNYNKTHRYLSGENRYDEVKFKCTGKKMAPQSIEIVEYTLLVDRYIETCVNKHHKYKNEYDLLSGTSVVVKSKQWISPVNSYTLTYNLYAFQKF
ncbi:YjbF family lipoprotein [Paracoccaceae bacterium]|nr:YjbF family lipoprotein [Paracoccaceae bacterium]